MSTAASPPAARGVERALADRRRQYEEEFERLLDATFRVMRERDTANPSVADILAASGLSTSAFYRHFPTKDDLLVTLLGRAHEVTRRHLEQRLAAHEAPVDRIVEWVRAMFGLIGTNELVTASRPFLLAHPRLLERFPDEIEAGFAALVAPLAEAIADGRGATADGTTARGDTAAAADARLAMHHVFGILVDRAALRQRADPEVVDAVASYTLRAVLPPRELP